MAFVRAVYKKGTGNDKQGKDDLNRMLCPYRNFIQAIKVNITSESDSKIKLALKATLRR